VIAAVEQTFGDDKWLEGYIRAFPDRYTSIDFTEVRKILGPPLKQANAFFSEDVSTKIGVGISGFGAKNYDPGVLDEEDPFKETSPLTWQKYGWLWFGVVDGKVRVIHVHCLKRHDTENDGTSPANSTGAD
jgi:hypothetical protein